MVIEMKRLSAFGQLVESDHQAVVALLHSEISIILESFQPGVDGWLGDPGFSKHLPVGDHKPGFSGADLGQEVDEEPKRGAQDLVILPDVVPPMALF